MNNQKIIPHLWFDTQAEEAARFYTSVFKGAIGETTRYTEAGHEVHGMDSGTVLTAEFEIEGLSFIALNGGPLFKFTPAISFTVSFSKKEDVDEAWGKLMEGGGELMPLDSYPFSERYGWCRDKFGLTWQLIYRPETKKREVYPSLMYVGAVAGKAEEAMKQYVSLFKDSSIGQVARYGAGAEPDKEGTIMYAEFFLAGQKFSAMDSGLPHKFTFNEAVSFLVLCDTQEEIDALWKNLSAVPESEQCGWLKDKFGVSWQIVPRIMREMLGDSDKKKSDRVLEAMLKMKKIDISLIEKAYQGK